MQHWDFPGGHPSQYCEDLTEVKMRKNRNTKPTRGGEKPDPKNQAGGPEGSPKEKHKGGQRTPRGTNLNNTNSREKEEGEGHPPCGRSRRHPQGREKGHPSQYYSGPKALNSRVLMEPSVVALV